MHYLLWIASQDNTTGLVGKRLCTHHPLFRLCWTKMSETFFCSHSGKNGERNAIGSQQSIQWLHLPGFLFFKRNLVGSRWALMGRRNHERWHFSPDAQYNISSVKMWFICHSRAHKVVMASHMLYWKYWKTKARKTPQKPWYSPETYRSYFQEPNK